jgi:hypothetical protein
MVNLTVGYASGLIALAVAIGMAFIPRFICKYRAVSRFRLSVASDPSHALNTNGSVVVVQVIIPTTIILILISLINDENTAVTWYFTYWLRFVLV